MHVPRTATIRSNSVSTSRNANFRPLTVEEYHVLVESGYLDGQPIELLNGVLTRKSSQSVEHIATTSILFEILFNALQNKNRAVVRDSKLIVLVKSNSEPEPDIVIASGVKEDYYSRKPVPGDILLIVEVSRSTMVRDSTVKLRDYASEGIPEYWIVDIRQRNIQVHRKPGGVSYESKETFSNGFISSVAFPDVCIEVKDMFRS